MDKQLLDIAANFLHNVSGAAFDAATALQKLAREYGDVTVAPSDMRHLADQFEKLSNAADVLFADDATAAASLGTARSTETGYVITADGPPAECGDEEAERVVEAGMQEPGFISRACDEVYDPEFWKKGVLFTCHNEPLTFGQIASAIEADDADDVSIRKAIKELLAAGKLTKSGERRGVRYSTVMAPNA
jgi:hypothetical protein